jgi:hypothetical protein
MSSAITKLVAVASKVSMTTAQRKEQQTRFSYGSAKIENDNVTEKMIREAAERISDELKFEGPAPLQASPNG